MAWQRPTLSTTARGYGAAHRQLRAQWARLIKTGDIPCWRCGQLITPGTDWDLGHDDNDRTVYRGPEHKGCNRRAAARKARRIQVMGKRRNLSIMDTSRQW